MSKKIKVRYYSDLKHTQFIDFGYILNIGVGKDHRGAHVSVITLALQDGTVITTTEAHVKIIDL